MSEFDQEDGHKKWFANPDFNPAQCNVVPAEHRENRTTAEKHTVDYVNGRSYDEQNKKILAAQE
jgi:hypothetical protein